MTMFKSYELKITPLSPVHIGTAMDYEPTNYVIDGDALYEYDTGDIAKILNPADRDRLLKAVSGNPSGDMIEFVQRFFYERRQALMAYSRNTLPVHDGVAKFYRNRIGQTAQRENSGQKIFNRLAISRTAFNPSTRLPVLYGSSLKGSIRTALLDQVNAGQRANDQDGLHAFQGRLFRYLDAGKPKFQRDPLRLLQIGDAASQSSDHLPVNQVCFAVNRKKEPVIDADGKLRVFQAEQKGPPLILECASPFRYRAFSCRLNIQTIESLGKSKQLPDSDLRFDIRHVADACNAFYKPILISEIKLLTKRNFISPSWSKTLSELFSTDIDKRLAAGDAFLLRVGRHSGADSVTVNGARKIKIMRSKGKDQKPEFASSSKTLWLAADTPEQQTDLLPFGWVLVEVATAGQKNPPEFAALRNACERTLSPVRDWAEKQARIAHDLVQLRTNIETQRRSAEETARHLAEEEARAAKFESERKAKLASLSNEERLVEEFKTYYELEKSKGAFQPNGQFSEKRLQFMRLALTWTNVDARKSAALILRDTASQWAGWPNKKERKEELKKALIDLSTDLEVKS